MATSSLAAALEKPEIVRHIDSCTELLPGVPASKENLQPLFDYICTKHSWSSEQDDVKIIIYLQTRKKKELEVVIEGPVETVASELQGFSGFWGENRAPIERKSFEGSVNGLVEALAYAKHTAERVRCKAFCSRCCRDGVNKVNEKIVVPVKKLKAHPLPYCASCTLDLATGGPPQKKVRHW